MTRVLVLGTGVTGRAVIRHFGRVPGTEIVVADDHPERVAAGISPVPVIAADPSALDGVDLLVPSPGVPPAHPVLRAAQERSVPVRSEIDLAAEHATVPIIAVTGTNGKTTVTTWIGEMLTASGITNVVAGNIGTPMLDAVREPAAVVVAEVSSFQLRFTTPAFAPRVGVLLNAASDHLDWHGGVDAYRSAKAAVFAFQRPGDLLVVNAGDAGAAALAGLRPTRRTARYVVGRHVDGEGRTVRLDGSDPPAVPHDVLAAARARPARHDVENAVAAALSALDVGAAPRGVLAALQVGPRLHHRVELVGQAGGVRFYDDSKATNPHATRAAVAGLDPVVLIAGGRNKGLDLGELRSLATRVRAVVAIGEAADEVAAAFAGAGPTVLRAGSMREAVRSAAGVARPGDAVLLSPACASLDWYDSYAARGDDFVAEVTALLDGRSGQDAPS